MLVSIATEKFCITVRGLRCNKLQIPFAGRRMMLPGATALNFWNFKLLLYRWRVSHPSRNKLICTLYA
jgi:hypothetical protein